MKFLFVFTVLLLAVSCSNDSECGYSDGYSDGRRDRLTEQHYALKEAVNLIRKMEFKKDYIIREAVYEECKRIMKELKKANEKLSEESWRLCEFNSIVDLSGILKTHHNDNYRAFYRNKQMEKETTCNERAWWIYL